MTVQLPKTGKKIEFCIWFFFSVLFLGRKTLGICLTEMSISSI